MCKKEKEAYMTIEASMIFPLIFGGIILVIYMGIYLYNASVIKQVAYIAALRGSQLQEASSSEIKTYVEQQLEKLLEDKVLEIGNIQTKVKVSYGKIKIKIGMDINLPFREWELPVIEKEAEVNRINPVDFIRKVRG